MAHYPYCFTINRLRLSAHLGWMAPERSVPQPVEVEMRLFFPTEPACLSNDNGHFLDYHGLSDTVSALILKQEYRLIEFMATEAFKSARAYADKAGFTDMRLWMRLTKSVAPVEHLQDGASFVMSDLPAGATTIAPQ